MSKFIGSEKYHALQAIINAEPAITNFELEESDDMHVFFTSIPTRDEDDPEDYVKWEKQMQREGYANPGYGGISDETISKLRGLGYTIIMNDCEGFENEGSLLSADVED
jgi:hypothetical protein